MNRAPEAAISLYAGLRDFNAVADADTKTRDLYSIPGVIDGPGENGNADNEWDVVGGAYLALDGYASTDPDNVGGGVGSHSWVLASPEAAPTGVKDTDGTGPEFVVGSVTPNPFGDEGVAIVGSPGVGKRHTLIYRLTVCDREHADTAGACALTIHFVGPVDHQDRGARHLRGPRAGHWGWADCCQFGPGR